MINVYNCEYHKPTEEETKILLKSLKPGQKLPLLNNWMSTKDYIFQLVNENYFDRLLEGYTLEFVTDRFINESDEVTRLIDNPRLQCIIIEIIDAIKCRGLDPHFDWEYGKGILLHNYKPNFDRGCGHDYRSKPEEPCSTGCRSVIIGGMESHKCIEVGFKINGTKIECYDYSP